jgi:hypothetical protein
MVLETSVFSPLNQLTRLVAREYFIVQCRRESYKSYSRVYNSGLLYYVVIRKCKYLIFVKYSYITGKCLLLLLILFYVHVYRML